MNDPTFQTGLLKGNSFQPYITDEYAFAFLLKEKGFPTGIKVYGAVPTSYVFRMENQLVNDPQSLLVGSHERNHVSPNKQLPIGVSYVSEDGNPKDRLPEDGAYYNSLETSSTNQTLVAMPNEFRRGQPMTRQAAVQYLQRNQATFSPLKRLPRQFRSVQKGQVTLSRSQWSKVVKQKTIRQKIMTYSKSMAGNTFQSTKNHLKSQSPQMMADFFSYSDDAEELGQLINTTTQVVETKHQLQTGVKIAKKGVRYSGKTIRRIGNLPKSIPKEIQWWKSQIFNWWQSPQKLLSIKNVLIHAIRNLIKNPIVIMKGLFVSLIPLAVIFAILVIVSATSIIMSSGVSQKEINLTKTWDVLSLKDYETTATIQGQKEPVIDGTQVEPSSVQIYSDIPEYLVYMNAKFEDYQLKKAISKRNPETHEQFLLRLYKANVKEDKENWHLNKFVEVIKEKAFQLGKKQSRYELMKKQTNPFFQYQELIYPFSTDKQAELTVQKRFGYFYKEGLIHKGYRSGIVAKADKGSPIYAPRSGTISYSGDIVFIKTKSKSLRLEHVNHFRIKEGKKVKQGTLIGKVSSNNGVYIEYSKKKKVFWEKLNPAFYFPKVVYAEKTTYQVATVEVSADLSQRALQVYQLFKKYYPATTINGAAAFLGNFQTESNINPKTAEGWYLSPPVGATASSWDDDNWLNMSGIDIYGNNTQIIHRGLGLGQFTDTLDGSRRNTLIREFAKRKGKKWYDLELQIEFMFTQDTPFYQSVVRRVLSSNDLPSVLANEVLIYWEGNPGNKVAERQANAIQWAKFLQNPPKAGKYIHAVANATTTSPFGWRNFGGFSEFHRGVDYAVPQGTPIRAIADGKVIVAEYHYSWGNHVQILHTNGQSSNYAHQSRMNVHVGQTVKQGDIIGYVGSTGNSTGPHLHLEISRSASLAQSELIDPATVLGK